VVGIADHDPAQVGRLDQGEQPVDTVVRRTRVDHDGLGTADQQLVARHRPAEVVDHVVVDDERVRRHLRRREAVDRVRARRR